MQAQEPIVYLKGLTKEFQGRIAVDHLDLSIHQGSCVALLGPNGAGKTTTINMLLGLVVPTSGNISCFGLPLRGNERKIKAMVGVTPQMDNLDPDLTVMENLLIYASYFRIPRKTARERAEELLEFFSLEARMGEVIQNLSGGQRRRLTLCRSLVNRPRLLILDEPTIGLDPQARYLIWERLEELKSKGTTMLLTTHYMEEASRLADQVLIMEHGRRILQGIPEKMVKEQLGELVYEISCEDNSIEAVKKDLDGCNCAFETHGSRLFVFIKGECPQAEGLSARYRHVVKRPTNLEDLFLHFTGRRLVENGGSSQ